MNDKKGYEYYSKQRIDQYSKVIYISLENKISLHLENILRNPLHKKSPTIKILEIFE